ncbi:hypothetical protein DMUE_5289 [Dictyocoela muelleri]|nr:hypothetical protein DMUE_5289 [Dictyocoela muelleri]
MLLCLSFLSVEDLLIGYGYIKQLIVDQNIYGLTDFITYYEKNYVGIYNESTKKYVNSSYSISFWNVYNRILLNPLKPTNNAESWNRTLNLRTVVARPNIAQFITDLLRQVEADIFNLKRAKFCIYRETKTILKKRGFE